MESSLVVVVGEKVFTFGRRQGNISTNGLKGRRGRFLLAHVCVLFGKWVLKKQSHVEAILFVLGTYAALDMRVCVCKVM